MNARVSEPVIWWEPSCPFSREGQRIWYLQRNYNAQVFLSQMDDSRDPTEEDAYTIKIHNFDTEP